MENSASANRDPRHIMFTGNGHTYELPERSYYFEPQATVKSKRGKRYVKALPRLCVAELAPFTESNVGSLEKLDRDARIEAWRSDSRNAVSEYDFEILDDSKFGLGDIADLEVRVEESYCECAECEGCVATAGEDEEVDEVNMRMNWIYEMQNNELTGPEILGRLIVKAVDKVVEKIGWVRYNYLLLGIGERCEVMKLKE